MLAFRDTSASVSVAISPRRVQSSGSMLRIPEPESVEGAFGDFVDFNATDHSTESEVVTWGRQLNCPTNQEEDGKPHDRRVDLAKWSLHKTKVQSQASAGNVYEQDHPIGEPK